MSEERYRYYRCEYCKDTHPDRPFCDRWDPNCGEYESASGPSQQRGFWSSFPVAQPSIPNAPAGHNVHVTTGAVTGTVSSFKMNSPHSGNSAQAIQAPKPGTAGGSSPQQAQGSAGSWKNLTNEQRREKLEDLRKLQQDSKAIQDRLTTELREQRAWEQGNRADRPPAAHEDLSPYTGDVDFDGLVQRMEAEAGNPVGALPRPQDRRSDRSGDRSRGNSQDDNYGLHGRSQQALGSSHEQGANPYATPLSGYGQQRASRKDSGSQSWDTHQRLIKQALHSSSLSDSKDKKSKRPPPRADSTDSNSSSQSSRSAKSDGKYNPGKQDPHGSGAAGRSKKGLVK